WKNSAKPLSQPASKPEMNHYVCNDDECPCSLTGDIATELAYGCYLCSKKEPPTRYADLRKEIQERIPTSLEKVEAIIKGLNLRKEIQERIRTETLSLLWLISVLCDKHHRDLRPFCSKCYSRIDEDGNIPPVGIWGFSRAGKTIFCAALMM